MNEQIMIALIKMIETGGSLALWGIVLYQLLTWLKVITIAFFIFLCVKTMASVLARHLKDVE